MNTKWSGVDGALFIKFGWYLRQLEADEYMKPVDQQRTIPSLAELARVTGFASSSIARMARGDIAYLNLELCYAVLTEMRRRGFDIQITDIIDFIGPPLHKLHQNLPGNDELDESEEKEKES